MTPTNSNPQVYAIPYDPSMKSEYPDRNEAAKNSSGGPRRKNRDAGNSGDDSEFKAKTSLRSKGSRNARTDRNSSKRPIS